MIAAVIGVLEAQVRAHQVAVKGTGQFGKYLC